jgi:hypothetical protein
MSKTRKQLIMEKYDELKCELLNYFDDDSIFPDVADGEYSITDIVFFFNFYFINDNYEETIEELLKTKNIELNDNDLSDVINLIIPFIKFLKNI